MSKLIKEIDLKIKKYTNMIIALEKQKECLLNDSFKDNKKLNKYSSIVFSVFKKSDNNYIKTIDILEELNKLNFKGFNKFSFGKILKELNIDYKKDRTKALIWKLEKI